MEGFSSRLSMSMLEARISKYKLAKECGISPSTLSNWINGTTSPDNSKLEIVSKCIGINKDWLINGGDTVIWDQPPYFGEVHQKEGDIFQVTRCKDTVIEDWAVESDIERLLEVFGNDVELIAKKINRSKREVELVIDNIELKEKIHSQTRPRIPLTAAAGFLSNSENGVTLADCEQLPIVHQFPSYDFTMFIKGDSMSPRYESGDEIACRKIDQARFVQWGKPHVLDTTQGIIVKRVYEDGDKIRCVSYNPNYVDFSIPKEDVHSMSLVVGSLNISEM